MKGLDHDITPRQQLVIGATAAVAGAAATVLTWHQLVTGFESRFRDYWAIIPIFGFAGLALAANGVAGLFGKQLAFFEDDEANPPLTDLFKIEPASHDVPRAE